MKYKYLFFLIPFVTSCELTVTKESSVEEKEYRKVGREIIGSNSIIQSSKAHELSREGVKLGIEGKYEEAEDLLMKALAEEPDHPTILNNIGLTYYHGDIFNTAIKNFNRALEVSDSTNIMAATNLGLTYYHQMDYGRALKIIDLPLPKKY